MHRFLITGGCGFIGSNFIRYLLEYDADAVVVNVDALTYSGNPANLADLQINSRYRFVHADIADRALLSGAADGIQSIIHFAAESHVDRSIEDSGPFVRSNVVGTQALLDLARAARVERFVHVSTDEVYGSIERPGFASEDAPLVPSSPYAASKAAADLLVGSYVRTFGLPAIITRCSNNYGPYQFPEKIIPLFVKNLLRDECVPIYGDGLHSRDWIHVRDHCAAIYRVWQAGRVGEVYNVGGGEECFNLELTRRLLEILEKPESLIRFVADRLGHDRRYAMDCSKIRQELGWTPTISFQEGLRETVAWYRENVEWVESSLRRAAVLRGNAKS